MLIPISPPLTLVESAYNNIKSDIISSYLKPDEKINPKHLSQRYNVSETPIKQALNRLISEGLVISVPRKGMWVHRISAEEADNMFDIRLMMDTFFIDQILENFRGNSILQSQMQTNVTSHIRSINIASSSSEYNTVYQLDNKFHELYISASGNKKIIELYRTLNTHVYSAYVCTRQSRVKIVEGAMEHQHILDALLAGEKQEVYNCVYTHIENARETVCGILRTLEQESK